MIRNLEMMTSLDLGDLGTHSAVLHYSHYTAPREDADDRSGVTLQSLVVDPFGDVLNMITNNTREALVEEAVADAGA